MTLLDAPVLAAIGDLSLVAQRIVDGFMFGAHPSRLRGTGIEFSQYRSYQPGDDLRRLDWRLFARSDRYFIRESDADTSLTVRLVLDASDSMRHEEHGVSKFAYGRMLAAALALIAYRQGDAVALVAARGDRVSAGRPDRGRQHYHRILQELEMLEPSGAWPSWQRLETPLVGGSSRGITIIVSDLHERVAEIRAVARKLGILGHDVAVLHLLGRDELEFRYDGGVTFEELETGRTVDVKAAAVREQYLAAQAAALREIELDLGEQRASYRRIVLDEPLDAALRSALALRAARSVPAGT